MMYLSPGTTLHAGTYRITRFISSGGFGCTYEGEHTLLGHRVAIKEFFVKDFCNRNEQTGAVELGTRSKAELVGKLRKKFIEEARVLFQFSHPNIVHVSDVFEEGGTAYYVMDYIDGESLHEKVKRLGKLSEKDALRYILQVADALEYVHNNNRLHLDIKPGNIMVGPDDRAILIDFGVSKHYDDESGESTSTMLGANTPGFAPQEQVTQSLKTFSPATDIYALGATFYKLLTGITPPNSAALMSEEEVLAPLPSGISASVKNAIYKAMEVKRKNRPQTIAEFRKLLESPATSTKKKDDTVLDNPEKKEVTILDEPVKPKDKPVVEPPKSDEPKVQKKNNNKDNVKFIFAVVLLLVVGILVGYVVTRDSGDAEEAAVDNVDSLTVYVDSLETDERSLQDDDFLDNKLDELNNKNNKEDEPNNISKGKNYYEDDSSAVTPVTSTVVQKEVIDNKVYQVVEDMPVFPGGNNEIARYLVNNIQYPTEALENGVMGRVLVQFIVEKDGSVSNAKVVRAVHPLLDKEALRVVNSMPKWTPGKQRGKAVRVKYTIPITFKY